MFPKISPFVSRYGRRYMVAVSGLAVGLIGVALITGSRAAGPFIAAEPESGSITALASQISDPTASANAAVRFAPASGGGSACALPKYPSPSCTGVPAGKTFTNTVNGTYTVTTPGQTIDGWNIHGDLHILADNTVIRNSQIDGTVNNQGSGENYYSFTISDSTVGPATGCVVAPGVGESRYTATRIYVRNHDDGFRLSGTGQATVQDSYFYACYAPPSVSPPDGSHSDGVQAVCGGNPCSGWQILHNTLDLSGVPATFPLNLSDSVLSNVTANDNLLLGGDNYLIYTFWHTGANWIIHNNRLVKDTWNSFAPWPRIDGAITADGTCSHQDWQGNTVVTIDSSYNVTGTVGNIPCVD